MCILSTLTLGLFATAVPWVSLQSEAVSFPENEAAPYITLKRSGYLDVEAVVNLQIIPGTATGEKHSPLWS